MNVDAILPEMAADQPEGITQGKHLVTNGVFPLGSSLIKVDPVELTTEIKR